MSLEKVISKKKKAELEAILKNIHPNHHERLWLVGFLHFVGYSYSEICKIILEENRWQDYHYEYTNYQVSTVLRAKNNNHNAKSSRSPKDCIKTIDELIVSFIQGTQPVPKLNVPSDIYQAAFFYWNLGFTPLPKHEKEKRPAFKWEEYQDKEVSLEDLLTWNWSHGICLLANGEYSFLDIDPSGYENFFHDRHMERTPRGGIHVFGKGAICSQNVKQIGELKGKGTLVVAYPTPGYQLLGT